MEMISVAKELPSFTFADVARLPESGDNAAIACRILEAGTRVSYEGVELVLPHTVLEGHRFAVRAIARGEKLLSWGLPFGLATNDIPGGSYLCNAKVLTA